MSSEAWSWTPPAPAPRSSSTCPHSPAKASAVAAAGTSCSPAQSKPQTRDTSQRGGDGCGYPRIGVLGPRAPRIKSAYSCRARIRWGWDPTTITCADRETSECVPHRGGRAVRVGI